MKNININTFNNWALQDKDKGMEIGHAAAVKEMLNIISLKTSLLNNKFNFLDLGCGNGWVVRKFSNHKNCNLALGIDGAPAMIKKAKNSDKKGSYVNANIERWKCSESFDIIFSMETFYYFQNLSSVLNTMYNLLNKRGIFIIGIDHYLENKASLNWDKEFDLSLNTLSIKQWITTLQSVGFKNIAHTIFGAKEKWNGTLILYSINKE
tara:strand:+ start:2502 stop:3125 length:624 start_codon:yes stop_codon:yes gene_type:complete